VLWLRFLNEVGEDLKEIPPEFLEEEDLVEALELSQESRFSSGELASYDRYWDALRVEETIRVDSLKTGESLGFEKGKQEGLEEGLERGLELGKRLIVEQMVREGLSWDLITKLTLVTPEDFL
jgi:hypothetical protein